MYPISGAEGYRQMFGVPPNVVHGIKKFIYTGTDQYFIVPDGVFGIWVSMCGGGGGSNAGTGGTTIFGNYLTATGGAPAGGAAGSPNGQSGFGVGSTVPSYAGSTPFGQGGIMLGGGNSPGNGYGSGGGDSVGNGGASGGWYLDEFIAVTPGQTILVQVGASSVGGSAIGGPGVCIVKF